MGGYDGEGVAICEWCVCGRWEKIGELPVNE